MSTESKFKLTGDALARTPMLNLQDLMSHYCVSERTIRRWVKRGVLQQPVRGNRIPLWYPLDILRRDLRSEGSATNGQQRNR